MTFAEKVKHVRSVLQLSQEKFAIMLGVSFATVNRLENGHAVPSYAQWRNSLHCARSIIFHLIKTIKEKNNAERKK